MNRRRRFKAKRRRAADRKFLAYMRQAFRQMFDEGIKQIWMESCPEEYNRLVRPQVHQ